MTVAALQQYLRSLSAPLTAAGAAAAAGDLERACRGLEPFRERSVGALADLLVRADAFEREGKLPASGPALAGVLVDEPTTRALADRLRAFLDREVSPGAPIPDGVRAELDKLTKLKLPQVKELTRELGVTEPFKTGKQGVQQIVLKLTGQSLAAKAGGRRGAVEDPAAVQRQADDLRATPATELAAKLSHLQQSLTPAGVKALAAALGVSGAIRTKPQGITKIREHLSAPLPEVLKLVEALTALKAKAEQPGASDEAIEGELRTLDDRLNRDTAIDVAKRLGVVRTLSTRAEALEAIWRKVFEVKLARESIAY
jgi:hypothetical protein